MEVSIESLETGTEVWVYKKDPKTPAEEKTRTAVNVRFNWFFEPRIQRELLFQ
jgi:hypothetical protein